MKITEIANFAQPDTIRYLCNVARTTENKQTHEPA